MELRLIMFLAHVLDPRRWRLRLVQLGAATVFTGWTWYRSVDRAAECGAMRDARRTVRAARIRERIAARERRWYEADAPGDGDVSST